MRQPFALLPKSQFNLQFRKSLLNTNMPSYRINRSLSLDMDLCPNMEGCQRRENKLRKVLKTEVEAGLKKISNPLEKSKSSRTMHMEQIESPKFMILNIKEHLRQRN